MTRESTPKMDKKVSDCRVSDPRLTLAFGWREDARYQTFWYRDGIWKIADQGGSDQLLGFRSAPKQACIPSSTAQPTLQI